MPIPADKMRTIHFKDIEWKLDPSMLDDLGIVDLLYELNHADEDDGTGAFAISPLVKLLAADKYKDVKKALRNEEGRIPMETVGQFVTEVFKQLNQNF